jgi:SAM-dependent methyltransferase
MSYALALSDVEIQRYRMMARHARDGESQLWDSVGIAPGAVVADVGCGPGAIAAELARRVAPGGRVIAVDGDEGALAAARQLLADAGVDNVELHRGAAEATGLPPRSVDVVMMRHVLAHNQAREQQIVDHLATLVRPGGYVYLVDIDGTAMRTLDLDPELDDLGDRYEEFHRRRGNDLQTGVRLGRLLERAGLQVLLHEGSYDIITAPPGMRPPPWAAREAMLAAGIVSIEDIARWERALTRSDAATARPTLFVSKFVGIGRADAADSDQV